MKNSFLPPSLFKQATPILGAAALGAIALLGAPEAVKAQGDCSLAKDGPDWVSTCPAGVDFFPKSKATLDFWLLNPDGSMGDLINLELSGPTTVTREAGMEVGAGGIIETTIEQTWTGEGVTLTGMGTGEIQDIDGDGRASSFFNVFAEIEGPFGTLRNMEPITVYGDRWLLGVPPDAVPGESFTDTSPFFTAAQLAECNAADPVAAIIYCGFDPVDFYGAGLDGEFGTGDDIKVAVLHAETHIVPPIPEPSAMLALVGLGTMLGFTKRGKSKKS
ncbi:MAG: PEP-CTERM sorting domain-containing protein [Cyanobacteriota bacterium]|nr:PEP-CTERM sorting domain-containing protein [Cyanobacteriota bacterium]